MTRLPSFLRELARTTGTPFETLVVVGKNLRAAGFLPPSKRGLGAEHVDARQAANLLLACMTDAGPSGAARALEAYRSLRPLRRGGFGKTFPALHVVADAPTFGAAMEALIAVSPWLKAQATMLLMAAFDKVPPDDLLSLEAFRLEITVSRPVPYARMALSVVNEAGLYKNEFSQEWTVDSRLYRAGCYAPEQQARTDLRTQTTITQKSLFRLGDLLAAADESTEFDDAEASRIEGNEGPQSLGDATVAPLGRVRKPGTQRHRVDNLRLPPG